MINEDFIFISEDNNRSVRLVHKDTKENFGTFFQSKVRSPEYKSALIVYEKYKRQFNLDHNFLVGLKEHVIEFSSQRKLQGKKVNPDLLVQECSAELKRRINNFG